MEVSRGTGTRRSRAWWPSPQRRCTCCSRAFIIRRGAVWRTSSGRSSARRRRERPFEKGVCAQTLDGRGLNSRSSARTAASARCAGSVSAPNRNAHRRPSQKPHLSERSKEGMRMRAPRLVAFVALLSSVMTGSAIAQRRPDHPERYAALRAKSPSRPPCACRAGTFPPTRRYRRVVRAHRSAFQNTPPAGFRSTPTNVSRTARIMGRGKGGDSAFLPDDAAGLPEPGRDGFQPRLDAHPLELVLHELRWRDQVRLLRQLRFRGSSPCGVGSSARCPAGRRQADETTATRRPDVRGVTSTCLTAGGPAGIYGQTGC